MAANMPQMVANPNMMLLQQQQQQQQGHPQQQQNKQLNQLVYSHLIQAPAAPMNSWQSAVSAGDRFSKAINLYEDPSPDADSDPGDLVPGEPPARLTNTSRRVSNTILAYPANDWQEVCSTAMDMERKQFLSAPDKVGHDDFTDPRPPLEKVASVG